MVGSLLHNTGLVCAKDVGCGVGHVGSALHSAAVDGDNLLHNRFLNDLHWLHNMLDVLDPLNNFMGNLHLANILAHNNLLNWIWALHMNDPLNRDRHVLNLAHRNVARDRNLHHLLDNPLHWDRDIPVPDMLDRYLDLVRLGNTDFIRLGNGAVHIAYHLPGHRVGHRPVHNAIHRVWDTHFLTDLNHVGNLHTPLDNLLNRVRLGDFNDLIDRVWLGAVNKLLYGVGHPHLLPYTDFNWYIHPTLNNLLDRVWHRSIHHTLNGVGHLDMLDALNRVWDLTLDNLLDRVRHLDMVDDLLVYSHWDLDHLLHNLLNRHGDILSPNNLMRDGDINSANHFVWDGDFHTNWNLHLTVHLHNAFIRSVNLNLLDTLHNLLNRDRDMAFNNLFHRVGHVDAFNYRHIISALNTALHNLLDRVRNTGLNNALHRVWDRDVNNPVDWIRDLDVVGHRNMDVVGLGNIHCANNFMRNLHINCSDSLNRPGDINIAPGTGARNRLPGKPRAISWGGHSHGCTKVAAIDDTIRSINSIGTSLI